MDHQVARILSAVTVLVLLLAGCSGRATPTPAPVATSAPPSATARPAGAFSLAATAVSGQTDPAPTATPTPLLLAGSVVLWHSWAQSEGDALAQVIEQIRQANPDLTIDTLFVAEADLISAYVQAVEAGGGPDLLLAPNWSLHELGERGAVLALDGLVTDPDLADFLPASLDSLRWRATLLGIPLAYQLVSLYANQALTTALPTTLDEWLEAARRDSSLGIGLYANLFHLYWGIPAYGAALIDADGRAVLDQTGDAAGYLAWLAAVDATPGSYVDTDYGMLLDRFVKGEFAYFVDGPWSAEELRAALGDALTVAPLPAGPAGPARPWLYADALFVNPTLGAEQQRLALDTALALSAPEHAARYSETGGLLPARPASEPVADPLLRGFAAQALSADAMPTLPEMDTVWGYAGDMLVKALGGVDAPPAIVAETTSLINEANGK
jgi:arabinogalactan oligomer/maltooligosaccharide transport system substrate-binding protein